MDKAAVIVDQRGLRLTNTQGMLVYEVAMGAVGQANGETTQQLAARLDLERRVCVDCGAWIAAGSIFCTVDAPYGFWHWLSYFSAIRWKRPGTDPRPSRRRNR